MPGSPPRAVLGRLVLPAVAVLLASCTATVPGTGTAPPGAGAPPGLERFYGQQLAWGPCAPLAVTAADVVAAVEKLRIEKGSV